MRSLRPRSASGHRIGAGLTALAAVLAVSGCTIGGPDAGGSGPPRLQPDPRHDVAAEMIAGRVGNGERLNACELLDLTTAEVIELTGADMPEVEPTGSGDLGLLCTYGGPGSPERYAAVLAGEDPDTADGFEGATDGGEDADGLGGTGLTTTTTTTTTTTAEDQDSDSLTSDILDSDDLPFDPDLVPDTFGAGVVQPDGGAYSALAGQAALLGARYACSEVRGPAAAQVGGAAPGAPEAPAAVAPELQTAYIDCVAGPAGGGVEVHTILVSDDYLWHITLLRPETPRSPDNESDALAGLHRVAAEILS